MSIYIVDEDWHLLRPLEVELRTRGLDVVTLADADKAFDALSAASADKVDLALIDLMLATGPPGASRYDELRTERFTLTGLRLVEDLIALDAIAWPRRLAIMTAAASSPVLRKAERGVKALGVPLIGKAQFKSLFQFGDWVEGRAAEAAGDAT